jgi:hypothetical protein
MMFWLRTVDTSVIVDEIKVLDKDIDNSLIHILGSSFTFEQREIIHLPLSMGGLGISTPYGLGMFAFVSSVMGSRHLQQSPVVRAGFPYLHEAIKDLGYSIPEFSAEYPLTTQIKDFSLKTLLLEYNQLKLACLFSSAESKGDKRHKVLLQGRAAKGASLWLTSVPNARFNTTVDPVSFRMALKYSVGIPLLLTERSCPDCSKMMDVYGDHASTCKVSSGSIDKHNSIVRALHNVMVDAKINCSMEASAPGQKTKQRPGDIFVPDFDGNGDAYFDVSVINTCCSSHISRSSKGPLCGAQIRYDQKVAKYPDLGRQFKPLVVEAFGGWHPYSLGYLQLIADSMASKTRLSPSESLKKILVPVSFSLQRHIGAMLVRRCLDV